MTSALPQFSTDQWGFLAVLEAFEEPIPIEVAGTLAPLMPGPLFDLLNRAEGLGLIHKIDSDTFCLSRDLPPETRSQLKEINTQERLSQLIERLERADLPGRLEPSTAVRLFARAGRQEEAGRIGGSGGAAEILAMDRATLYHRMKKLGLR